MLMWKGVLVRLEDGFGLRKKNSSEMVCVCVNVSKEVKTGCVCKRDVCVCVCMVV